MQYIKRHILVGIINYLKKLRQQPRPISNRCVTQSGAMLSFKKRHMEKEIWKDVPGYESLYQVSSIGNVKSLDRYKYYGNIKSKINERILKPFINSKGYKLVSLYKDCKYKKYLVHRLVYLAFIGELNPPLIIDHINNSQSNNSYLNLQQISIRENRIKDKPTNKYTSQYPGIFLNNGRWVAKITINWKEVYLGSYKTEKEAADVYMNKFNEIESL